MAAILALASLLRRLMARELSSLSSVGLNNFFLCIPFLMAGSTSPRTAFWATALFQVVLVLPLLVSFSADAQDRLPQTRVTGWPLGEGARLLLTGVSFALHPLVLALFAGFSVWMGLGVGLAFVILGAAVHAAVFAVRRVGATTAGQRRFAGVRLPTRLGGVVQVTVRQVASTLDFWTAVLLAVLGTTYRVFGHATDPEAFPVLALLVAVAMSTVAQRLMSLEEGTSRLRYRLLPLAGWRLLVAQDAAYVVLVGVLVLPLDVRAGVAFALAAVAIGRYPSVMQAVGQRRWRFTAGDLRFGAAQVVLGGGIGMGAARVGWPFVVGAVGLYVGSVVYGSWLWRRGAASA